MRLESGSGEDALTRLLLDAQRRWRWSDFGVSETNLLFILILPLSLPCLLLCCFSYFNFIIFVFISHLPKDDPSVSLLFREIGASDIFFFLRFCQPGFFPFLSFLFFLFAFIFWFLDPLVPGSDSAPHTPGFHPFSILLNNREKQQDAEQRRRVWAQLSPRQSQRLIYVPSAGRGLRRQTNQSVAAKK